MGSSPSCSLTKTSVLLGAEKSCYVNLIFIVTTYSVENNINIQGALFLKKKQTKKSKK